MSTFWRTELQRLIDEHRAAGHVLGPGPGLDPDYLDERFWHVVEKANEEKRTYGAVEFSGEVHQAAEKNRRLQTKKYVASVLARHRAEVAEREDAARRVRRGRMRIEMHARGIEPIGTR